ncbi:MAG TPA: four helix bundle protein [Pyrinomonadaceae bacterium]|jgi:four helix bundle protein|nr:four helix bundle protein [Pyrinomonadaceae bacterium]
MVALQRFEDLEAWKLARLLTNDIYDVTLAGDFSRDFSLRDQIRRASISIVSNIAEGYERDGDKEFLQFLYIAKGSCGEVRAQLYLAYDRKYLSSEQFAALSSKAVQTSRVISGLIKYLRQSQVTGKKFKATG